MKVDGRFGTTSFNHASLADGMEHHVMLHASGLNQHSPPRIAVYVDCSLVHTVDELPAVFGALPPGPNRVALRTLQSTGQVRLSTDPRVIPGSGFSENFELVYPEKRHTPGFPFQKER